MVLLQLNYTYNVKDVGRTHQQTLLRSPVTKKMCSFRLVNILKFCSIIPYDENNIIRNYILIKLLKKIF